MNRFFVAVGAVVLLDAGPSVDYKIDATRYFATASAEATSRAAVAASAQRFVASATPQTARGLNAWLDEYDALLASLERHDIYVYLRAEENDVDTADARADDELAQLEDRVTGRVVEGGAQLGSTRVAALARDPLLAPHRYLLADSLAQARHRLSRGDSRAVDLTVTPVLDAAAATYKNLRKSPESIGFNQQAYAALLVSIAAARSGAAKLRGFGGAAQASYFDKSLSVASVDRTLAAVRSSQAYAQYRRVAALTPSAQFSPAPLAADAAMQVILAAELPMGDAYAGAYAALLDPGDGRVEICTAAACDRAGFSLGSYGVDSAVFYGGFDGSVNSIRALAHESGHAVHRQFMSRNQPIAAYNRGPAFMFESFAIFNELLLLDHLYRAASSASERTYYLDYFLKDAAFQVFGSAEETELESAIYRGVDDGTIRTAADLNALTVKIFARYDPASAQDPQTPLYWARDRLFFTDPLYDVNYLYAGLLALQYFADFERNPSGFSRRYVALLKNGFNDTPAVLERRFLGIDLNDEPALVANAGALIEKRTKELQKLLKTTLEPPR
ncbi:MAG: M3 family metallopeptidase [Candidatus Cybelea sp.]